MTAPLIARCSAPVQRPVVLMIAFGLDEASLQQAVAQAMPEAPDDPAPVFLVDHNHFSPLTKHDVLFEHFPSATSMTMLGSDLPWARYAERRIDLLVAKWRPVSIIPLGRLSLDLLSSWRSRQRQPDSNSEPSGTG